MGWWRIWSPDSPYTKGTPATGGKYYEAWLSSDSATDLVMMLRLITGDTWYCNEMEDMRDEDYIPRSGYDKSKSKDGKWMAAENFNAFEGRHKYEVVQIFPSGYIQSISLTYTLEEAKKDIEEFPHHLRHYGKLGIKKLNKDGYSIFLEAENFGGDPEGKLAKALERARKKAKQPRKPLKIERLKAESFGVEGEGQSYCYSCDTKTNTPVIGYKGNTRGATRIEAFCDEECRYYAGYGDTCCSRTKCNCGEPIGRDEYKTESFDAENRPPSYMADSDAHKLIEGAWRINSFVESGEEYPQWWKSRLSVAASTVDDLADYLDYAMSDDYEAEENQYEFWSVWENDDDYDSVSDFDTEQEAIDFYEKMIKKHGEDSYLLFGNDGKGGVVELEVVFEAESLDAETFNAYSVDLYEDEDTPPYYPYLAPEYTTIHGRGRYRFNRYGTDGMTHEQFRFTTKDAAIEWLCYAPHQYRWVKPNQPQYDFPPNTPDSQIKKWYKSESFRAENRSLAKRSWDALNNVETAVGTVGLAHMIGIGAIFGGGLAFLKGRKSNSKTEK